MITQPRLVLAKFNSPDGVMTLTIFSSMTRYQEVLAHYPLAHLELFTMGPTTNHIEMNALALAVERKSRGLYGEQLVPQMFQMRAYRMGEVGQK